MDRREIVTTIVAAMYANSNRCNSLRPPYETVSQAEKIADAIIEATPECDPQQLCPCGCGSPTLSPPECDDNKKWIMNAAQIIAQAIRK